MKHPDVEFLLPGSWRFVPVADQAEAKRAIARTTEQIAGRSDERARMRAEIRARFTAAADRARGAGGEAMWICDEIMPGVPLPASIVLYRPPLAVRPAADAEQRRSAILDLVGQTPADAFDRELTVGGRPAVRRATTVSAPASDEPDAPLVETVESDYWILQPDDRGVLLLVFACGMPLLKDKLVELFDVIVTTLRWSEQETPVPA